MVLELKQIQPAEIENRVIKNGFFPMFVDISDKRILVIGGGKIACRRIKTLLLFSDHIMVVAPRLCDELMALAEQGEVEWVERRWRQEDVDGFDLVLAATDDRELNRRAVDAASEKGCLVNAADDRSKCDFYFPGIVKSGNVTIGISTGGENPAEVKRVRNRIIAVLEEDSVSSGMAEHEDMGLKQNIQE